MAPSPAQLPALKASIEAETDPTFVGYRPMRRLLAILALAVTIFAGPAAALDLSPAQQAALRADILADPVLGQLQASSNAVNQIITAYAAPPAVACTAWKSVLTPGDARAAIISASTQVDALSASKRDLLFFLVAGDLNPTDPAVRAGLDDAAGTQTTLKAALQAAQKRATNRLEKLFATGACSSAAPSTMAVEGALSYQDVLTVMGW